MLVPLAILVGVVGLLLYSARDAFSPAIGVQVVPVVVKPMGAGEQPQELSGPVGGGRTNGGVVQAPGWIEPDPFPISVPALVEGVVREVLVLEGDRVEAGQVVAHLVDDELRLAERSARAIVVEREADLARAEATVATARAYVLVQRAALDELRDEIDRKRELVDAGGLSPGEYGRKQIRQRGLEAGVAQADSLVAEAVAGVRQAEAALETAQATLADASLRLTRAAVRAPVGGVVMNRLAEPGMRLSMGGRAEGGAMSGAVVRLYDPDRLQVRVDVPLADAAKIGIGTAAQVSTEALPDVTFTGRVSRVVHEANIQRNTVQFKVAIQEPSPALKPEMLCRVRFIQGSNMGATAQEPATGLRLVLPRSVVINHSGSKGQVWIVQHGAAGGSGAALLRDVTLGPADGDDFIIRDGLNPGDRVIASPPNTLRSGSRVRILSEATTTERP